MALTAISQPQFWPDIDLANYGDGKAYGIISVDISDWKNPGRNGKGAEDWDHEEIDKECWAQLVEHFSVSPDPLNPNQVLREDDKVGYFLDPDSRKIRNYLHEAFPTQFPFNLAELIQESATPHCVGYMKTNILVPM
jgi:hypothetical protein